jgi:hypothetical protein
MIRSRIRKERDTTRSSLIVAGILFAIAPQLHEPDVRSSLSTY